MRETRGWFLWCGIAGITEKHEEIRNLTKAEVIERAMQKATEWPRVLICQKSAKYPRGACFAGIEYGRMSGRMLEDAYNAGNSAVVNYVNTMCRD